MRTSRRRERDHSRKVPLTEKKTPIGYFFTPRTASFAALATRNLTTVLAGILIFCCVFGLKPVRAFLFCFTSLPKPGKTNSPFFLISLYASTLSVSRNTPAVLLSVCAASASALEVQSWSSIQFITALLHHFKINSLPRAAWAYRFSDDCFR